MKTNKIPVPRKSSTRIWGKSNEAYSTINREVINRENTSISHAQFMEKFGFQRSTTPKYQSGQINTHTNYSSKRPQKIYYHRPQNKPTTQAFGPNIIRDYRKPNQSFEQLGAKIGSASLGAKIGSVSSGAKIGSSSPQVFEQDKNKGGRAANQPNEQFEAKKDIELLGAIISQNISQNISQIAKEMGTQIGREIGKEISKEIGNKFTTISQKLSGIMNAINLNSSNGSLNRSKNSNGNTSIHSLPKDSLEKDSSSSHYNYKKRTHK